MRLFIAINLPPSERDRLQRAAGALRAAHLPVRWVGSDALHLTLKFLGEVPDARRGEVEEATREVSAGFGPFQLELRGLGAFPRLASPRVLWVGVHAPPELARLAGALDEAMGRLGFPREERPFSPHLTLGRAERDAGAGQFKPLPQLAAAFDFASSIEAHTVDLMRSQLSPRGARYERLLAAPLAGQPADASHGGDREGEGT